MTTVNAGGTISLANLGSSTINGPFTSAVTLNFDRIDAASTVAFNPFTATANGTLPPGGSLPAAPLTGSATNITTPDPYIPLPSPANYVAPPATPLPSLTGYSASWAYISPPGPLTGFNNATVSGRIAVRWHYSYDLNTVPAPLPLAGAGIAFAWSRGLRRRVRGVA